MTKQMIDAFSGLGGASEAFLHDPNWDVVRIESNIELLGEVPQTWFADITKIVEDGRWLSIKRPVELLWGSPPCRDFSQAYSAPAPTAKREGREFEPDMSLLEAWLDLRDKLQPRYWVLENVVGAIKHFRPYVGEPSQIIGPFVLWSNIPEIIMDRSWSHRKEDEDVWSSNPLRANIKAKIPIELSEAVKESVQTKTMRDYE